MIVTGARAILPTDALGGCFEAREMTYDVYDAGFDVAASRDVGKVTGLRANGPAAKAGLHEGDAIRKIEEPKDAGAMMKVEVEGVEGGSKTAAVSYRASSGSRRGQGFKKRAGLSDEACRKLALRK